MRQEKVTRDVDYSYQKILHLNWYCCKYTPFDLGYWARQRVSVTQQVQFVTP